MYMASLGVRAMHPTNAAPRIFPHNAPDVKYFRRRDLLFRVIAVLFAPSSQSSHKGVSIAVAGSWRTVVGFSYNCCHHGDGLRRRYAGAAQIGAVITAHTHIRIILKQGKEPMIRAFLFDMDGTLIDTEILWVKSMEMALHDRGIAITREEALDIVYGISWDEIYEIMSRRYPGVFEDMQAMYADLRPRFLALRDSHDVLIPGSIALLKRLAGEYPVAIVSGSFEEDVAHGVRMMGVESDIRFYLAGDHYAPGKPNPACYRMAAARLGLPPDACLAFEDSEAGIRAAKDAGMYCVALARPDRPRQDVSRADWALEDLNDFTPEAYAQRQINSGQQ